MKKSLLLLAAMLAMGMTAHAENNRKWVKNFNVGVLAGDAKFTNEVKDYQGKYKLSGCTMTGYTAQFEAVSNGMRVQLEGFYGKVDTDPTEWKKEGNPPLTYDTSTFKDEATAIGGMVWIGGTMGAKKRVQLPVYVGLGAVSLNEKPLDNVSFAIGLKARLTVYLTDGIGLFAGYGWKMSSSTTSSEGYQLTSAAAGSQITSLNTFQNLEAGLTFMLFR